MEPGIPWGKLLGLAGTLLAAGLVTGLLAGLLGIGGGGILVPVLYEVFGALGVDDAVRMHLAVGTSLAVIVPTSLRSFAAHRARGAVDLDLVRSMAPWVVLGVALGAVVARYSNEAALKGIWVAAAAIMSLKLFLGRQDWQLGDAVPGQPLRALYGGFVGLVSTLMSIGGGVFITALMTLYGQPMQRAVATSSAFGPIIAIPGALGFIWAGWQAAGRPPGSLGYVSVLGALVIIPASVLAAPLGVRIAHGISRRTLELAFATFLTLVGGRFLFSLIGEPAPRALRPPFLHCEAGAPTAGAPACVVEPFSPSIIENSWINRNQSLVRGTTMRLHTRRRVRAVENQSGRGSAGTLNAAISTQSDPDAAAPIGWRACASASGSDRGRPGKGRIASREEICTIC